MPTPGYYRFPAIYGETIAFTAEDDLWLVPAAGGVARRLTAGRGGSSGPFFSPDGAWIAYTGREEGHDEVYVMPAAGGPARRLTYLGASSSAAGWTPDGRVLFASDHEQPFDRLTWIYAVPVDEGAAGQGAPALPERWPVGPAMSISIAPGNRTVIGRNNNDPARWKRYRGGRAGELWIDAEGDGEFRRLLPCPEGARGNLVRPLWVGERIFFLSDHEGVANLYSCLPDGEELLRHTDHRDFFARFPNSDGVRIVYHAGGDLYLYDPAAGKSGRVPVEFHTPRVQRARKFVEAAKYLESYAPHPEGHSLAVTIRGQSFTLGNWEGAVTAQGGDPVPPREPVRYRLTRWLNDGRRVVTVADRGGSESLEVHYPHEDREPDRLAALDVGRPYALRVSPANDHLLLNNHRNELVFVDLAARSAQVVDRSPYQHIMGFDWSPDGRWAAYGFSATQHSTAIRLWDRETGATRPITGPLLRDVQPVFDPGGKYLYFLGERDFNPVYDNLHFDLGFPRGMRPFLVTLQAELRSPFAPEPHPLGKDEQRAEGSGLTAQGSGPAEGDVEDPESGTDQPEPSTTRQESSRGVRIDLEGIERRVVPFPVPEGLYGQIAAIRGKALFTSLPVEGALGRDWRPQAEPPAKATLECFDFASQKRETLVRGITDFQVAADGQTLVYRAGNRLRVVRAGVKPDEKLAKEPPGRKSGWVDLGRVRVSVDPGLEWRQMAREAWRLQREYFWTEDMSRVDWEAVWERYAPLVERISSRGEFSDLLWELQGELGTSHAYEIGGDYRPEPSYPQGFLGADFAFDAAAQAYRIARIVQGTPGEPPADSPLNAPGARVQVGDRLIAINGRRLTPAIVPQQLLVHQADAEVVLTVAGEDGKAREVTVKALRSEFRARYREWVEENRRRVHAATGGRAGYVHVPDMGPRGYAEFHRLYLTEVDRDGLVVDVRFNRGGHVSQLLIEKLARRRVGYAVSRWGAPTPYPRYSVAGPMVAVTNQWAGSDGDIFSHVFKLLRLGPLVGKRTWGGVVGIWPRNPLADGSITTQPEFSFWFQDVGWGVENYGTDPDVEVDITPQEYTRGEDPQLDRAIAMLLERLEAEPPARPLFGDRPDLGRLAFNPPGE